MLEITEVAVKNGQSKDTGYIGHARNEEKQNTHKNKTQKSKKMSNTNSTNTG
jgi:hypothetical protein